MSTSIHPAIHDRRHKRKDRPCINCDGHFFSISSGNRTCPACRRQLADAELKTTYRSEVKEEHED